jgi:uncharacterized protein YgbK (DUF1537 family)
MKEYFLADDLSGALDAAAAFHHAGRRVKIVLTAADWITTGDEVVGVTTETRNCAAPDAAEIVARALAHGRAQGARLVYKKIDSTLRGPVAAEIAALAAALPAARILFCPANPTVGRTVREGVLLVHGVPVDETEFARDPVSPVRESNLRRLLGDAVGAKLVVADAESDSDLAAAVAHMAALDQPWVAVGSGALARPVAALGIRPPQLRTAGGAIASAGPVLMLGGSAHAGNRAQAAWLARERGVPLHTLHLSDPELLVAAAIESLQTHGGASILVEERRHDSAEVLRILTTVAVRILVATKTDRLFATGGETAFALCGALGISTLAFQDEIEPGLALARAGSGLHPMLLAVKPGGFGTGATWVRAWDRLTRSPAGPGPAG